MGLKERVRITLNRSMGKGVSSKRSNDRSWGLFGRIRKWLSGEGAPIQAEGKDEGSPLRHPEPHGQRIWRLLQVESALACNLSCIMCPWKSHRAIPVHGGIMPQEIWAAIEPALGHVRAVDFTGAGEPLLQPKLPQWMSHAKKAGCIVGLLTNGLLLTEELARELIDIGVGWVCFSMDSPYEKEYEYIRKGSHFTTVRNNISYFCRNKGRGTRVMMNFVMMELNFHGLEDFVRMAADLGVDQINFRQCEHVRGKHGRGLGLFGKEMTSAIRKRESVLHEVCSLAKKLGIDTQTAPFVPFEQCVCSQDPRDSLFVRYDGAISPCNSLAYGGSSVFLGEDVEFPEVVCGNLSDGDLFTAWSSDSFRLYRNTFTERCRQYEAICVEAMVGDTRFTPERLSQRIRQRLHEAPEGCKVCLYLYGF